MSDPQDDKTAHFEIGAHCCFAGCHMVYCSRCEHEHCSRDLCIFPQPRSAMTADPVRPQDDWPRVKCGLNGCENTLRDIDPTADKSQDPEWWMQFCSREHRDAWEENHDITLADLVRPQETLRDRFAVALRNASTSGVVDIHISKANACLLADAVLPIMEEETARQLAALRDKVKARAKRYDEIGGSINCAEPLPCAGCDYALIAADLRALIEEPQGGER